MSGLPTPLNVAARRLGVAVRTLQDRAWRERHGLVDVEPPPCGAGCNRVWLKPESVRLAAELRAAVTAALYQK